MKCVVELTEAEDQTVATVVRESQASRRSHPGRRRAVARTQDFYNWTHAWREQGVCGLLTAGRKGGRPRALSEAMLATAMEVARTESITLGQIAKRIEAVHGEPMPCALETLSVALRREGFSFKRNRFSLKKSATRTTLR